MKRFLIFVLKMVAVIISTLITIFKKYPKNHRY